MITAVHSATLLVTDQQRSVDFFVGLLGWRVSIDYEMGPNDRFVTVIPPDGGTELSLGQPGWFGFKDRSWSRNSGISLVVTEIDKTYAELSAKGVRFKGAPEAQPWGDKATWLLDPDDNELFIVEMRSQA